MRRRKKINVRKTVITFAIILGLAGIIGIIYGLSSDKGEWFWGGFAADFLIILVCFSLAIRSKIKTPQIRSNKNKIV
jgi:hypothetical protein